MHPRTEIPEPGPPVSPAGYRFECRRPLHPAEVEDQRATVVEAVIRWGDSIIYVSHHATPSACAQWAAEKFAEVGSSVARAVTLAFAADLAARRHALLSIAAFTLHTRFVARARPASRFKARDQILACATGGAALSVALILHTLFALPAHPLLAGNEDTRYAHVRALVARQQARPPRETPMRRRSDVLDDGTGTAPVGPRGITGSRVASSRSARLALPRRDARPRLARAAGSDILADRGVFVALRRADGAVAGGASGVVSPFGAPTESGSDRDAANGGLAGSAVGDAFGYGGLSLNGVGFGGGGLGASTVGLGQIGTVGRGYSTGSGTGYGGGAGLGLRGRSTSGPLVRCPMGASGVSTATCAPQITGMMSPAVIRRVVLRNIGQVRHCHESGLAAGRPDLSGLVVVRFVIGSDGGVVGASVEESSLGASDVDQCVANAVRRWQFPAPESDAIVTVRYPFDLQLAE